MRPRRTGSIVVTSPSTSKELHMAGTLPCRLLAVDSFEACWVALGQYGADSVVCASHGRQVENCEAYSSHCPGIPSFFARRPHKTPSSGPILEILATCWLPRYPRQ